MKPLRAGHLRIDTGPTTCVGVVLRSVSSDFSRSVCLGSGGRFDVGDPIIALEELDSCFVGGLCLVRQSSSYLSCSSDTVRRDPSDLESDPLLLDSIVVLSNLSYMSSTSFKKSSQDGISSLSVSRENTPCVLRVPSTSFSKLLSEEEDLVLPMLWSNTLKRFLLFLLRSK